MNNKTMQIKYLNACQFIILILGSFLFSTTILAQDQEEQNTNNQELDNENDFSIEEIVVTAQKRSENLRDVPIALSVFGSELIEQSGIQELKELSDYIPNLSISQGADFGARIVIRGVGANSRNIGFDARVGVYLDGVYLGQGPALNQDLVDLDRIEVLRGPQGTLFGKNTIAGAISLISKKPNQELSANLTANVSNFNGLELKADINIPFGDKVAGRFYISDRKRDGYVTNIWDPSHLPTTANIVHPTLGPLFGLSLCDTAGGSTPEGCVANTVGPDQAPDTANKLVSQDTQSYRAQFRILATDNLDINIGVDGLDSFRDIFNGEPLTDTFGSTLDHTAPEPLEVSFSERSTETRDIFGTNLSIDYALENGYSLRSISAYRETDFVFHNDTDASALDFLVVNYADSYEQTTQEFQLISPDNMRLEYVLGFYYYNQDSTTIRDAVVGNAGWLFRLLPGGGAFNRGNVETDSKAVFLNGSYDLSDAWRLGFGFRYSDETKDVLYHLDGARSGVFGIGSTPASGYKDSDNYTHFSPTLSINYRFINDVNLYAKYSSGFKSGGFNLDYVTQADLDAGIDFNEETVDSYELGMKGLFLNNRLSLNLALFVANYDDYQVNQFFNLGFDPDSGTQLTSIRISNAAKVETSGLELEAVLNLTASLTLNASLGLLDATFKDFPGGSSIEVADSSIPGGVRRDPVNAAGNRLPFASDLNAAIGIQHDSRIDFLDANFLFRLDITHTGDYFTTIANDTERNLTGTHGATFTFDFANYGIPNQIPYGYVDSITRLNARVGLIDSNEKWDVYLWARNLTNEQEYLSYVQDFFGSSSATPMLPRTYGIEVSYHF